jgi:hypothetical protein
MKQHNRATFINYARLRYIAPWIIFGLVVLIGLWEAKFDSTASLLLRICAVTPVISWLLIIFIARKRSQLHVVSVILTSVPIFLIAASGGRMLALAAALAPIAILCTALIGSISIFRRGWKARIIALIFPFLVFAFSYRLLPERSGFSMGQIWSPEVDIRWDIDRTTNYLRNFDNFPEISLLHGKLPIAKAPDEKRVIVLGSSQVVSPGLKDESKLFTAIIERRLNKVDSQSTWRVYNAGMYGTDIIQWVYWRDMLSKTDPDILVIYESGAMVKPFQDRVAFNRAERIDKALATNDIAARRSAFKWGSANSAVIGFRRVANSNRIAMILGEFRKAASQVQALDADMLIVGVEPPEPKRGTVLQWFAESGRDLGVRLILISGVHRNLDYADPTYAALMRNTAASIGGEVLDARPPKDMAKETSLFLDDSHFSPAGHRWVGQFIAGHILPKPD